MYFSRRFFNPSSFCFNIDSIKFDFKKGEGSISESKEKINRLLFIDDLKMYSRSEKGLDSLEQTVRIFSENIGMEFRIEKCGM